MKKLPVYLALDSSGSMHGEPIRTVEDSVAGLIKYLREDPDSSVYLSITTFGSVAIEVQRLKPLRAVNPPKLTADGSTMLGSALHQILNSVRVHLAESDDWFAPEVIIMTDGRVHDDWRSIALKLKATAGYVIGIGVGPKADLEMLAACCSSVAHIPRYDPNLIRETFKWIGEVIRVSNTSTSTKLYPAPPAFVTLSAGTNSNSKTIVRWDEDGKPLSEMQRNRVAENLAKPLDEVLEAKLNEERKLRVEEERLRREEEERRNSELQLMGLQVDVLKQREMAKEAQSIPDPSTVAVSQIIGKCAEQELKELVTRRPPVSLHDLAQQSSMHLMTVNFYKSESVGYRTELLDQIKTVLKNFCLHRRESQKHSHVIDSIQAKIAQLNVTVEGDAEAHQMLYSVASDVFNVVSYAADFSKDIYLERLREILRETRDSSEVTSSLVLKKEDRAVEESDEYRIIALEALDKASSEISKLGDLELARSYLEIASCASVVGSPIDTHISILFTVIATLEKQNPVDDEVDCDEVDCTVFSPARVARSRQFLVQVFFHLPEQAEVATKNANEGDPSSQRRGIKNLSIPVKRGERLKVTLSSEYFSIEEPEQIVKWCGKPCNVQFLLSSSENASIGSLPLKVIVQYKDFPVGKIHFVVNLVLESDLTEDRTLIPTGVHARRFRKAFVSYASEDRAAAVLQTRLLPKCGIDLFLDVLILDPGQRWEEKLYRYIEECDLFLLFWSRAAEKSEWVRKETGHALDCQRRAHETSPEIYPMVLPPPPPPKPWDELGSIQLNDRLIYIAAAKDVSK